MYSTRMTNIQGIQHGSCTNGADMILYTCTEYYKHISLLEAKGW